ncbi:1,4-dihydroxy-2-naphthoyl-CoA synthase [bioreactor metagenome]|uniref:1,4-dihydroxy-2-naphthoyl-CoA synthase n=1 Tax=bioreactor metagenome TaxID=1076179 RepID=A0A645B8R0_9ZZZZ
MSQYESLLVEPQGNGVVLFTINRPQKKNALNATVVRELQDAFIRFDADESTRVAVLTGAGNDAFSAGADLHEFPELWRCIPTVGFQTDKPIIGAVSGWCIGGALVLAMMADLLVASESAKFNYPEAKVGFTGGIISGLAGRIPHHAAMEVILLCRTLEARRAYDLGFVNEITPVGEQVSAALKMAQELAVMSPMVLATLKRFVNNDVLNKGPSEQMARTLRQLKALEDSADYREGMTAFKEKRQPVYTGK